MGGEMREKVGGDNQERGSEGQGISAVESAQTRMLANRYPLFVDIGAGCIQAELREVLVQACLNFSNPVRVANEVEVSDQNPLIN